MAVKQEQKQPVSNAPAKKTLKGSKKMGDTKLMIKFY